MNETPRAVKIEKPWAPYAPTQVAPWNLRRVVHLHRRAGFAATWSEIHRDLKDAPQSCIDRVLAGKAVRTPLQIGLRGGGLVEVLKMQTRASSGEEEALWEPVTGKEEIVASDPAALTDGERVRRLPFRK